MNYRAVFNMVGIVLLMEGGLLIFPLLVTVIYGEALAGVFLISIAATALTGALLFLIKPRSKQIYAKEGFFIVSLSWVLVSLFGCLPMWLSGAIPSFIDALFETISGFTTTGASILTNIEILPKGVLFWRSFTHWIGGMGVLVFMLAFLPRSNERTMHVIRAEIPGPSVGKLVPTLKGTAKMLYIMYTSLTALEIILLVAGGMPLFDSIVHSFGTAGTGGFSIMNQSIGYYGSAYIDGVITVFMMLFGINFSLYFLIIMRNFRQALKSEELKWYLVVALGSMLLISVNILGIYPDFGSALRAAAFQVSSIMTTTGYATADFNTWPLFSKIILFLLMLVGACGGSTGGGLKVSRVVLLVKKLSNDVVRLIHPRSVRSIKLDGKVEEDKSVNDVLVFFATYVVLLFALTLLVSLDRFDFETTLSAVTACMGNIGPGLGAVGPMGNYAGFSVFSKIILSLAMLLGRLEIFPLLIFLIPGVYRKKERETGFDVHSI